MCTNVIINYRSFDRRVHAAERLRASARKNLCVAYNGDFGERSRVSSLLNTPQVQHTNLWCDCLDTAVAKASCAFEMSSATQQVVALTQLYITRCCGIVLGKTTLLQLWNIYLLALLVWKINSFITYISKGNPFQSWEEGCRGVLSILFYKNG